MSLLVGALGMPLRMVLYVQSVVPEDGGVGCAVISTSTFFLGLPDIALVGADAWEVIGPGMQALCLAGNKNNYFRYISHSVVY